MLNFIKQKMEENKILVILILVLLLVAYCKHLWIKYTTITIRTVEIYETQTPYGECITKNETILKRQYRSDDNWEIEDDMGGLQHSY